jgi:hypothetical protein
MKKRVAKAPPELRSFPGGNPKGEGNVEEQSERNDKEK